MIIADNIVKVYPGGVNALGGISFHIEQGEICGYLGSNGAGKSTTIKILCGMLSPSSGTALINGFDAVKEPNKVKKMIGYVPESGALFLSLTPFDFLEFVCRMYDIPKADYTNRIHNFMELFDLKSEINSPMHTFSKGMRQKVLIISSLIHNPEIIIWDEPLSGLDFNTSMVVRTLVKDLAAAGKTFFYSTHIVESVDKICTRVLIINSGKIVYDGGIENMNGSQIGGLMEKYGSEHDVKTKLQDLYKNTPDP